MRRKIRILITIQAIIWFIFRTIESLFWYFKEPDNLGFIVKSKLYQFLIPSLISSFIIIIIFLLGEKITCSIKQKLLYLFFSIVTTYFIYFGIVTIYFKYIWHQPLHSTHISHIILAGYNFWLLFFLLNFSNYAIVFWTEHKSQKLKLNDLQRVNNEQEILQNNDLLNLSGKTKISSIKLSSIKFIQADTYMSKVVTEDNNSISLIQSLKKWEQKLPKDSFLRIHKSFIVNLKFIEKITPNTNATFDVHIKDSKTTLQMSRRIGKEFYSKVKT